MLTVKQNLLETIHGGNPDRFVNQYEYLKILFNPIMMHSPAAARGEENVVNDWGITYSWKENWPGGMPIHTSDKIVVQDVTRWKDVVHAPTVKYSDAEWEPFIAQAEEIDRDEFYVAPFIAPGIFEQCHHLLSIEEALMNFYDEPEAMHELIAYITDWEMRQADELCAHLHCDAIFHHDDWGSQTSTFLAPDMFEDFFLEPYKALYGHYKELGVEVIVHHSDSYAATLVPDMIDMGIDVWQGVMTSNDIPSLIKKYGNKMTYMGGIDDAKVDYAGWSQDVVAVETKRACTECGKLNFIPCLTHGLNYGVFPGVYESVSEEIDKCSKEMF